MPTKITAGFVGVPFVEEEVMMAYDRQFVLAIMDGRHPIREIDGKVTLPFNSEYKIRLKNKNNVRAKARVWIDGRKVSNLGDFILNPGETLDLERFLDDSMSEGNRFKFVPLSDSRVNDPTDSENGIVKVEFYREQVLKLDWNIPPIEVKPLPTYPRGGPAYPAYPFYGGPDYTLTSTPVPTNYIRSSCSMRAVSNSVNYVAPVQEHGQAGATVEGSNSNQKFTEGHDFNTEIYPITLTLKIQGPRKLPVVTKPDSKPRERIRFCGSCGRRRYRQDRFCRRCGWQFPIRRKR